MARLIGHFAPGSPEWHAARANAIGGSEVAPLLGLSPFESRFSLWHRKAGHVGPVEESPEMEWGKRLEPAILAKFADEHPELYLHRNGPTLVHDDRPWQLANPDGIAHPRLGDPCGPPWACPDAVVVEAKCSRFGDDWGEPGTDEIPVHYRTQVLWYLDTLGLARAHVAVLIAGCEYREYVVDHQADEAAQLRTAAEEFLADVAARRRPPIDDHTATYQVIKTLNPEIDGTEVMLPGHVALGFIRAYAALKAAKAKEQQARSLVADAMGNAHRATWDGSPIARRQQRGEGLPYVVAAKGVDGLLPTDKTDRSAA